MSKLYQNFHIGKIWYKILDHIQQIYNHSENYDILEEPEN